MKKLLLIISLCLFSFNAFSKSPADNVDTFFKECKDLSTTHIGFCQGYILASIYYINGQRVNKKLIDENACNPSIGEMRERFCILYQRNQFEIGSSVDDALYWTHVSLCPTNPDGIYKPKNSPKSQD